MCSKCKEGFYDENGSTTCVYAHCPVNCQCISGQKDCVSCIHGFYDTSTSCSKKCPVNCLTCESEKSCNDCKSGFYNEYEYDNNINIQLNNCSYACRDTCTECQSYNNCLQCMEGKYGQTCQECPINCAGGICERTSGTCNDCNENFQGEKCAECIFGNYGPNCNETCSKYCANKSCDRATSKCIYGCMMGYSGDRCCLKSEHCVECTNNTECSKCESGYFKNWCNEKCPEHCLGPCDIMTGECSNCPYNRFGQFCEYNCSENCKFEGGNHNKVCTQSEGTCINGCENGYFGRTCNETCKCFCVEGECRQDDGVCTNGCYGHQEEPECTPIETQKDDDNEAGKTSAIELLGALFAVSAMVNIVQGVYIFVKQRKEDGLRQSLNVNYENQMVSSVSRFSPNNDQEHEYLQIENTYHADQEHEYLQIENTYHAANTRSLR